MEEKLVNLHNPTVNTEDSSHSGFLIISKALLYKLSLSVKTYGFLLVFSAMKHVNKTHESFLKISSKKKKKKIHFNHISSFLNGGKLNIFLIEFS